ncbi:hypothetical protein OK074_6762 [Actinobacteria bacterium OK074]|nr:hypothetical protein OK074_6762 [Actinobacteria bacterium OK074]
MSEQGAGNGELLCDVCGVERAPFLRFGTLHRTGRICAPCLRQTQVCGRCAQLRPVSQLVAVRYMPGATGPGWTEYACRACPPPTLTPTAH